MQLTKRRWRCQVCGYEHIGVAPPDVCPVCGVGAEMFDPSDLPAEIIPKDGFAGHLVIVGAGIAAVAAAAAARGLAPACRITLINGEPEPPNQRINLTRYLAGAVARLALPIHPLGWYADQRIEIVSGPATSIDTTERRVGLPGQVDKTWDRLILATGATANLPPFPGRNLAGVHVCRSLADADTILASTHPGTRVVVIGGGLLGLENAGALTKRGAQLRVLEQGAALMGRQLDIGGGACLARHLARIGIEVRVGVGVGRVDGTAHAESVVLKDGRRIAADLVLIAAGVRANTDFARSAGIPCGSLGIEVDDSMATGIQGIWAAGDCCEHRKRSYGLWTVAEVQGAVAGANAVGGTANFLGLKPTVRLKVLDTEVISIGQVSVNPYDHTITDESGDVYRRLVLGEGHLLGAVLVGDGHGAHALASAIELVRDLPPSAQAATDVESFLRALATSPATSE